MRARRKQQITIEVWDQEQECWKEGETIYESADLARTAIKKNAGPGRFRIIDTKAVVEVAVETKQVATLKEL